MDKQRANRSASRWWRGRTALAGWLGRYRFQAAAALGGATVLAFLALSLPIQQQPGPDESAPPKAVLPSVETTAPSATRPTAVPTHRPPRLTREEAIRIVSSQPSARQPGTTLADTAGDHQWTAEYRGDSTWIVRAGEPAWLLLEDGPAAMPANVAAINLQGADRGGRAR